VAFNKRAWHAGESFYQNRQRCNDFSIGIELEGFETTLYTQEQYDTLNVVIERLLLNYPRLSRTRIVGHSDIAPHRKTDPGVSFDWSKLK
jgi:AmpD protein